MQSPLLLQGHILNYLFVLIENNGKIKLSVSNDAKIIANYGQVDLQVSLVDDRDGKPYRKQYLVDGVGSDDSVTGFKAYAADLSSDGSEGILIRKNQYLENPAEDVGNQAWTPTVYDVFTFSLQTGEITGQYWDDGSRKDISLSLDRIDKASAGNGDLDYLYNTLYWDEKEGKSGKLLEQFDYIIDPKTSSASSTFFSVIDTEIAEGELAEVAIRRTGDLSGEVSINVIITGDSAAIGNDFKGGNLIDMKWLPGEEEPIVEIQTIEDSLAEADESFTVMLTGGDESVVMLDSNALVIIKDNDSSSESHEPGSTYLETKIINASTWSSEVRINLENTGSTSDSVIQAKQVDKSEYDSGFVGSIVTGASSDDIVRGLAGFDQLFGKAGDDLIHGGNGRDIIDGGSGSDELHGDFGWNTFKNEQDSSIDLIAIKSDQYLINSWDESSGNNPNGEKADFIEGLDSYDQIKIVGVSTQQLNFKENVTARGVSGIGIYAHEALEAVYTGGNLSIGQITEMTNGETNVMWSYWGDNTIPELLA